MDKTLLELTQHIRDLCAAFNILHVEDPKIKIEESNAIPARIVRTEDTIHLNGKIGRVVTGLITTDVAYCIALHEIGHIVHPSGSIRDRSDHMHNPLTESDPAFLLRAVNMKIMEEESAWEWARKHALQWTIGMEQCSILALKSYYDERSYIERISHIEQRIKNTLAAARARTAVERTARKTESMTDFLRRKK